jgi:hypothetical protein
MQSCHVCQNRVLAMRRSPYTDIKVSLDYWVATRDRLRPADRSLTGPFATLFLVAEPLSKRNISGVIPEDVKTRVSIHVRKTVTSRFLEHDSQFFDGLIM